MRRPLVAFLLVLAACLGSVGPGVAAGDGATVPVMTATDPRQLVFPPLPAIRRAPIERCTLPNGMQVLLLEDHGLPLIHLKAWVRAGSVDDPPTKIGMAALMGGVLRTGGSTSRSGDEVDRIFDRLAATVDVGVGDTAANVTCAALRENFDEALTVLTDILMNPRFPEDKLEIKKGEAHAAIARRNDEPVELARREFAKLVYGRDSVYARHSEHSTVAAVGRDDLVAFHHQFFTPERMIVAVWGDFSAAAMKQRLTALFGDWRRGATPVSVVAPPASSTADVTLVGRADLNQSVVMFGHLSSDCHDPDLAAILILNEILGGTFTGRLFKRVRSDQGLTYRVFGGYVLGADRPGLCTFGCSTRSGSTVRALDAIRREVELIRAGPISDDEVALAKESYRNAYVYNFTTLGQQVHLAGQLLFDGYPPDFIETTLACVASVTAGDIQRVARERLRPEAMRLLVVGNPAEFDGDLARFGEVHPLDVAIPAK